MKFLKTIQNGFTLLEIMIAVSLFVTVMLISTTMLVRAIDSQTRSINSRALQENLNYALAYMSYEASGALVDPTSCSVVGCSDATQFFCSYTSNTKLTFKDANSLCVTYDIKVDTNGVSRLEMKRSTTSAYLTPPTIQVTGLKFNTGNTTDPTYPIGEVTISIIGQTLNGQNYPETLQAQTTIATTP